MDAEPLRDVAWLAAVLPLLVLLPCFNPVPLYLLADGGQPGQLPSAEYDAEQLPNVWPLLLVTQYRLLTGVTVPALPLELRGEQNVGPL